MGTAATPSADPIALINEAISQYQSITGAPGVCVSVIYSKIPALASGVVIPQGWADLHPRSPVKSDTLFQIGSETKLFTSLLTAIAVGQGTASLSDPAINYLKAFGVTGSSIFNQITLDSLATHTSGLPDLPASLGDPSDPLFADQPPAADLISWWNRYNLAPLDPPCWLYSNLGFITLGFCVSSMLNPQNPQTNQYNDLLSQYVTGPLGMTQTGASPSGVMSQGYRYVEKNSKWENEPAKGVAADLKSTGDDMLTFLQANLGLLDSKLPASLVQAIRLTQTQQNDANICGTSKRQAMGLAWQIDENGYMFYKNGATGLGGESCAIELFPSVGFGVSVLTNQCPNHKVSGGPTVLASLIRAALAFN